MVTLYLSSNLSLQNLKTKEDFPTAASPNNTIFTSSFFSSFFICLLRWDIVRLFVFEFFSFFLSISHPIF